MNAAAHDLLTRYRDLGFELVFYSARRKGPTDDGWPSAEYRIDDYREGQNVGVKTGVEIAPGKFLGDADFDWADGIPMVKRFFPSTAFGFGRESKPLSHAFYTTEAPFTSLKFDLDNKTLLELRSRKRDGTIGYQTMVPPSLHPSGEMVTMKMCDSLGHVEVKAFVRAGTLYAVFCAVTYCFGVGSQRFKHEPRLAFAGFLLDLGLEPDEVITIGECVAELTGNTVAKVRGEVESTVERRTNGGAVTGGPHLADAIGPKGKTAITLIRKWVGRVVDATEGTDRDELALLQRIEALNERFFIVDVGTDTVIGEEIEHSDGRRRWSEFAFRSFEDFKRKLVKERPVPQKGRKPTAFAELWLQHERGRQYDRLVYAPPGSPVTVGSKDLQGWRGFTVEPAPGDWSPIEEFILDIICDGDKDLASLTLDWMAALAQKPGRHAETAPVVIGGQGTGKNFWAETVLAHSFDGRHAKVTTNTRQIVGEFNKLLSGTCLVVLNEAGLTTQAEVNAIKGLITAPTVLINRKGIDAVDEPSMLHFIFLSNAGPGSVMKIEPDDRRFIFYKVSERRKEDIAYFASLYRHLENGGRAAMLDALLRRDVNWDRLRIAPRTAPKQQAKRANWSPVTWFLYLQMRELGQDHWANFEMKNDRDRTKVRRVVKADLAREYGFYLQHQLKARDLPGDPQTVLQDAFRAMFAADGDTAEWNFNRPVKVEGVATRDFWTLPDWADFKARFAKFCGDSLDDLEISDAEQQSAYEGEAVPTSKEAEEAEARAKAAVGALIGQSALAVEEPM